MKKIEEEKNKIRNEIDYSEENKQTLIETKEKELIEKRDSEMAAIDRKINDILKKKGTALVEKGHLATEDLPARINNLQEKLNKVKESEDMKSKQI